MDKENNFGFYNFWYDLWMKQSKEFFESANHHLRDLFETSKNFDPEEHLENVKPWLNSLKNQWRFLELNEQQLETYALYLKMMNKFCDEAADRMLSQWIKRSRENNPIKNIHELYELWLNCCHEVYTHAMHSKSYQKAYGEFMNEALKFWKSGIPNSS